ncbi:MAG TPA: Spo0B domain-containing protein [Bacillota bacterium]|nr:Spo0B domain-containing protein [Bacillota bacterium]
MEDSDILAILRQYRHDLMNHLQIIQGYATLGQVDKVKQKIDEYVKELNKERKLVNLNAPSFALWLIQFNGIHTNIQLTYDIHIDYANLESIDVPLTNQCDRVMALVKKHIEQNVFYEGTLTVMLTAADDLECRIAFQGHFTCPERLENHLQTIQAPFPLQQIDVDESSMSCVLTIPKHKR